MRKKIISLMITFCLVMSSAFLIDSPAAYAKDKKATLEKYAHKVNPMQSEITWGQTSEYGHVSINWEQDKEKNKGGADKLVERHSASVYDSSYNTYEEVINKYPGTRDQNPYGTCWAFAATALAELDMVHDGDANKNDMNLSELQVAYFNFNTTLDPFGYLNGDSVAPSRNFLDNGGNMLYTMNTLAQGKAFTTEEKVPYSWARENYDVSIPSTYAFDNSVSLDQLRIIDLNDEATVKQAIIDNGAVYISYGYYKDFCDYYDKNYYCPEEYEANHDVVIVGWDDNYKASNFAYTPPGDGAWLVRNSWTTNTKQSVFSYFYISYYDGTLEDIAFSMDCVTTKYDNIYQHDGGIYHTNIYVEAAANVFTVADTGSPTQQLEAVRLTFTNDFDIHYQIDIYKNLTSNSDPTSGTLQTAATTTGWTSNAGIYTVPLDAPVVLKPGDTYSIVVTALNGFAGYDYNVAGFDVETSVDSWFSTEVNIDPGESFMYYDSYYGWEDLYYEGWVGDGNLSIKGLTTDSNKLVKPELKVSNVASTGKPKLTWSQAGNVDYYEIYRKIGSSGTYEKIATTTSTSYTHKGAKAGKKYSYQVKAVVQNEEGEVSIYSNSVSRVCDLAKPTGVKVSNVSSSGKPKVTWDKVEGADKYEVWRATSKNGSYTKYYTTTSTSYVNSNATAGKHYYYRVRAVCNDNEDANSAYEYVDRTCDLAKPTNIKATNVSSSGKPKVTWDKVEGADKYYVYRAIGSSGSYEKIATTTSASYTHTGAKAGKLYYYKVVAVDADNEYASSAKSDSVSKRCDLAKPINVKASNVSSSGKPKVTWDKVEGADKYYVYRAIGSSGTYEKVATTSSTSYTHTGAKAGKLYYYKVVAVYANNENANSAKSDSVSKRCDLAKPTNVKISTVASSGKPKITWSKVDGADKYEVYRATSKNGTYTKYYTTSSTSYTNTSATAGYTYYYKVKAIYTDNTNANSAYSSIVSMTCDCAKPSVSITRNGSGKPKLSWKAVDGASKYEIYRATSKNGTYEKYYTTTSTSYTNTSAKAGKTYYYKVKAICGRSSYGNSAYSSIVSITAK